MKHKITELLGNCVTELLTERIIYKITELLSR